MVELTESKEQAVRAELARVVEGPVFRGSKRCREFLEYVVERTLRGPGDTLKERSIGVELFKLPPDFDSSQHTIVRVTANEVRKKLAQFYMSDAAGEVRIDLPPGSYSADFRWAPAVVEPAVPNAEPAPAAPVALPMPRVRRPAGPVIACVAAVLIVTGVSWWFDQPGKPVSADARPIDSPKPLALLPATSSGGLRMIAGSTSPYFDRSGRTWSADQFFTGGNTLVRPSARIFRTLDPDIYRHLRSGDFRYDIPLAPGQYEMHLHFAETGLADFISAESSGEGQRVFRVSANGTPILSAFDVVADSAGAHIADERVFRGIAPADDGILHLSFTAMRSTAMLSGIELLPMKSGRIRPIRIRAGFTTSWQDPDGQQWQADSYFLGGNALVRNTNPAQPTNSIAPDMALYASERWGHFTYALPVAEGRYRVTLKFCEGHYGKRNVGVGGAGSRVFDVHSNGVALLRNFDILKEAGGEGRPIDRVFSGIRPNAQGKIVLAFVPVVGMACVNGIEVEEDLK